MSEREPFQLCNHCPKCGWWTGAVCLQEPEGFARCPVYGKAFVVKAVVGGQLVRCPKGWTPERMRLNGAAPRGAKSGRPGVCGKDNQARIPSNPAPACGVNLFDL